MHKYHFTLVMIIWIILSGCFSEEASAYRKVIRTENPRKIQRFIRENKESRYAEKAEKRLEKIEYKRTGNESGCIRYLAKYPDGKYTGEVMNKLEDMRFEACESVFACERYIKEYPDGKYINDPLIIKAKKDLPELKKNLSPDEIDSVLRAVAETPVEPVKKNEVAVIETKFGIMKMRFFPNKAPNHCANFKRLAKAGYYNGTTFHRVIPEFMIQGGDIFSRDGKRRTDGTGGPGYTIDAEFNDIPHTKGIVSMARTNDPNSAGSQFFICDGNPTHLDGQYTVFGEIFEGSELISLIANLPKDRHSNNPHYPVHMRVTIIEE